MENYVKEARAHGMSDEQIRQELLNSGWEADAVDAALSGQSATPNNSLPKHFSGKLPGVFALLKESFSILKQRLGTTIVLLIIPLVFEGFIYIVIGEKTGIVGFIGTILSIISAVVSLVVMIAMMKIADLSYGADFKQLFKFGMSKWLGSLVVGILFVLILIGGTILLIIPGVIFFIWYSFSLFVYIHEGLRDVSALKRSKQLVKSYWWAVFGRLVGFFALMFLPLLIMVGIMIGQIVLLLMGSLELGAAIGLGLINIVLIILFAILFVFVIQPVSVFYNYLIYKYLRAIKGK